MLSKKNIQPEPDYPKLLLLYQSTKKKLNNHQFPDLSAFILAGGKSSRMGTNKALLSIRDRKMISYSLSIAAHFTSKLYISGEKEEYRELKIPMIKDQIADIGPIGGIYSCLNQAPGKYNLFLPCDTPYLTISVIENLLNEIYNQDVQAVIASSRLGKEPLIAVFKDSVLPAIRYQIQNEIFSIRKLFSSINILEVDFSHEISENPSLFKNINSPGDLPEIL